MTRLDLNITKRVNQEHETASNGGQLADPIVHMPLRSIYDSLTICNSDSRPVGEPLQESCRCHVNGFQATLLSNCMLVI